MSSDGYSKEKSLFLRFKIASQPNCALFTGGRKINPYASKVNWIKAVILISYSSLCEASCPLEIGLGGSGAEGYRRDSLRLFEVHQSNWQEIPQQIDPTDGAGGLVIAPKDYLKDPVKYPDRMQFFSVNPGPQIPPVAPPCRNKWGREIVGNSSTAWVFACEEAKVLQTPIDYDPVKGVISSKYYRYSFNPENHILFQNIEILQDNKWVSVAHDSNINFHLNVKNFFNLNLGPSAITSKLEDFRLGPLGLVGKVSFYLNLLFFKIKLSLITDVYFYEKQVNVPMIMYAPRDLSKNLNQKSGIYYSWKSTHPFSRQNISDLTQQSFNFNSRDQQKCGPDYCNYQVSTSNLLNMKLKIPVPLVQRNFIPFWASASAENHKIAPAVEAGPDTQGLYFEVSSLPKGEHKWDFWMSLQSNQQELCPHKGTWGREWNRATPQSKNQRQ